MIGGVTMNDCLSLVSVRVNRCLFSNLTQHEKNFGIMTSKNAKDI